MKRLILVLIFFLVFPFRGISEKNLRLTVGEWAPFHSEKLKFYGVVSRIISEAFALEGVKVNYDFFSWARAIDYAKHGDWDGCVPIARTLEREPYFYWSAKPVYGETVVFFHLKSYSFDWNTIKDLKGIEIGLTIGYSIYGEKFNDAEKQGKLLIERVPSDVINFRKLLKGRIQIFPTSLDSGYRFLQKNFTQKEIQLITYHPKSLENIFYYLVLSKKIQRNKRVMPLFNKGIERLRSSGKYDQYFKESREGRYLK